MSEFTRPCSFCGNAIPDSGVFYTDVPENHKRKCPIREIMELAEYDADIAQHKARTMTHWIFGPSLEKAFYSIVDVNGVVIAQRILTETNARQICDEHNDFQKVLALLDAAGVSGGLVSDRVQQLILERAASEK